MREERTHIRRQRTRNILQFARHNLSIRSNRIGFLHLRTYLARQFAIEAIREDSELHVTLAHRMRKFVQLLLDATFVFNEEWNQWMDFVRVKTIVYH
jgi:hypothetical protein